MYDLSIEEALSILDSSIKGLSKQQVEERSKKYGPNLLELEEESIFKIFTRQFINPIVMILIFSSFVALYFSHFKDFIFIIVIVLINGLIGFYQEFKAKVKLKELLQFSTIKVDVLRDGKIEEIPAEELTIGDIVILREGDIIPADIRFIETNNVLVDESLLTGESIPVEKFANITLTKDTPVYRRTNIGFSGSAIKRGVAKGVVYGIGLNTEMGNIYSKLKVKERGTPLRRTLEKFSKILIIFIVILLSFIFIVGIFQGRDLENLIMLTIAQLVSSVPEGLPIVITIALVIGAGIMHKKKVLIRQLSAVEGLGSATFICTDKTGTITENRLTVGDVFSIEPELNHLVFALANDSDFEKGDPLEIAMLKWLENNGYDYIYLREKYGRIWLYPFDTNLKLMASINRLDGKDILFIKGAFESLEKMANNTQDLDKLRSVHDQMTEAGLRVLAFGYTDIKSIPDDISKIDIRMIGLIGFIDPPKETAKKAVESAKKAGINIIMITGDNLKTAKAVASMVGIHQKDSVCLEGIELNRYTDNELKKLLKNVSVIARASPEDKYRIVRVLQETGEEVVMIGDGVNDMPAVKSADLGIAMNDGSKATKSVAKMVLLERDLSVIIDAIRIGRVINHNLRKVILYLTSTNIGEIFLLFLFFLLGLPQPLYATQILWINIMTDGILDKPIVLTKEEKWIFSLRPEIFSKWFLDKVQFLRIISFAIFLALVHLLLFRYLLNSGLTVEKIITIIFTSTVFSQWALGIQAIREYPFFYNLKENFKLNPYVFLVLIFVGLPLQYLSVNHFGDFLHSTALSLSEWLYPLTIFLTTFIFIEVRKWIEFYVCYNKGKTWR